MTLFLAGHNAPTANALNWTWYLLAHYPEVEAKLHAEIDTVLGGRPATFDDLKRLPYTAQVIKESMRLYPPAWNVARQAIEDVEIGGYTIESRQSGLHAKSSSFSVTRAGMLIRDIYRPERWTEGVQAEVCRVSPTCRSVAGRVSASAIASRRWKPTCSWRRSQSLQAAAGGAGSAWGTRSADHAAATRRAAPAPGSAPDHPGPAGQSGGRPGWMMRRDRWIEKRALPTRKRPFAFAWLLRC